MAKKFRLLEEAEVSLDDLKEDPENPNLHGADNLDAIEASIKAFGQVERLAVRKKDGVVFAGNGRLTVLRRMGLKTARVQYVAGDDAACRAFAIAANQTTRMSKWDDGLLLTQLEQIRDADLGGLIAATGFDLEDIADMRHLIEDAAPKGGGLARGEGGTLAKCPSCGQEFRLGGKP